jgi:alkylation response protein AidB-like acyl-CoA dehydrogenase
MTLLVLDEEQEALAASARAVADAEAPVSRFRAMRDRGETHDAALWAKLVSLGWPALPVPEAHGGLGMGLVEVSLLMEALGRNLAATPLLSTVMAARLSPQASLAEGSVTAVAWREHPRYADARRVDAIVMGGRLFGTKRAVLDAEQADRFLVSALWKHDIRLFEVDAADAVVAPLTRLDHRSAADVRFDGAPVADTSLTLDDLVRALDAGCIALAAEQLGGASAALDMTLAYLQTREQFGRPIGAFQALKHRAVDCFVAIELARSAVRAAAHDPTPAHASLAKAQATRAYLQVADEAIQMHGGIGMTDEHDVGFHLKRARVAEHTLGDVRFHEARWASLHGY